MNTVPPDLQPAVVSGCPSRSRQLGCWIGSMLLLAVVGLTTSGRAEDSAAAEGESAEPKYPLAVAVQGDSVYVVDLMLPGVWRVQGDQRELFVRGSKSLRTPLNRPRCIAVQPQGGILVGDSATREIYHIAAQGAEPKPLSGASIGIPMAVVVSPDGETVYVGDAETKAVLRLPISGGEPEPVVRVNARGLAFDREGSLWAVTPDDAAVHRIDVAAKTSAAVVTGRPYQYPNGLAWAGDHALVTDGYGQSIWKVTADGKTEPWFEGEPLRGPVGIAVDGDSVWVADPKQVQVFQFDRVSKRPETRLP